MLYSRTMAKSKRSKVKMAYKAMRRQAMEKKFDENLRKKASKTYNAVGLPMPPERPTEARMPSRTHNGCVLVTTFVPTAPAPKRNIVHGPLARDSSKDNVPVPIIGFPIPGAGAVARMEAETMGEEDDDERVKYVKRPYFYPRRRKSKDNIRKNRVSRHPKNKDSVEF